MTTWIWAAMLLGGSLLGLLRGQPEAVSNAILDSAAEAVRLCGALSGSYCLYMGLLRVAEQTGFAAQAAKLCRRPLERLFPAVKQDEKAMHCIAMNIGANMLGLGQAATPFGLQAMAALQQHNKTPKRATHEMCMFLLLNTASVQLLPLSVIALRTAEGAAAPWDILPGCIGVTALSAAVAVLWGIFARRRG